jgi:hypothetical protein
MELTKLKSALKAGIFYFLGIFILGFVMGAIRTFVFIPRVGALAGVLIEIPIMLTVSWYYSSKLKISYSISIETVYLIIFGGSAFVWLMLAEYSVSVYAFNQSPAQFFANIQTLPGSLGLFAQIVFGCIPVIQKYISKINYSI